MIGRIRIRFGDDMAEAVLGDDLVWRSGHKLTETALNVCYSPLDDPGPAHGRPGVSQVRLAAEALGGEVIEVEDGEPGEPGTIY